MPSPLSQEKAAFWLVAFLVPLLLFLTTVETSIATTSLVAISQDLGNFDTVSWVLTGYTLGYGVGGGSCFALATIVAVDLVPPEKFGPVVARIGIAIVLAMVSGPIIGGLISDNTTWRWIFLFNVPLGILCFVICLVGIPNGFPYHAASVKHAYTKTLNRIDFFGFFLLMAATVLFAAGFQEADGRFAWDSAYVIALLVLSLLLWIALVLWERRVTRAGGDREPVLPWRFFTDRAVVGIMLCFVLVGAPMGVTTFQLPQRFQLVNGLDSFNAGIRLIPYGAAFPVGSSIGSQVAARFKIPAVCIVFFGSVLQTIGYALLGTLDASSHVPPAIYGYEVLCGLGCGATYQALYIMVPFAVETRDKAVGMGAANQFRWMGTAFGIAIATSVFNGYTVSRLESIGIPGLAEMTTNAQNTLPQALRDQMREILSSGYSRQMLVLCGFSAAEIPVGLLIWKRPQILIP
ncbi:putative efflux pump antibiotic resistance protein [Stachybotrys elegans]|uniref:Efflux pump antibiotic resistance protein n=1 Tax=Stachybotrys elegans TaxID=80388 RepID=A0A8K0SD46_9HYPO|nr:putative efflux pump antibiotic resistance protein [Stachybotrys elegans]